MAKTVVQGRAPAIGIDLGTTHCCMAYLNAEGKPIVIKAKDGDRTMPSHVAFTKSGRVVGARAKTETEKSDHNTIFDAKRLLGRSFNDPEVAEDLETWPFAVEPDAAGLPRYRVQEKGVEVLYAPEQISGMVLSELREAAQLHFGNGKLVADAVITVPAYFNDDQRQATKAAAEIAKLNVVHMINEPTAAALAFGMENPAGQERRNVLVFDLGGGTFDTVLLGRSKDVLEVRNVGGDTHLGGQDFDWALMKVALRTWDEQHPDIVIENGSKAWRRLRLACESAKKDLSTEDSTAVDIYELEGGEDFLMEIDRDEFDFEVSPLFDRCMAHVTALLKEASLTPADVNDVVVVGGASRMPGLRTHLENLFPQHFGTKLHMTDETINADEAVAIGAAVMAAQKSVPQDNWRPGGAGLKAAPLPPGPKVVDVVPMTLGIQHGDLKKMHPLVHKGSPLPAEGNQKFSTLHDQQTVILFQVYEGEAAYACDNHRLGEFRLPNIRQGPAGDANILVTMRIGENGVLHVTAIDQDSGTARQLVITAMNRADSQAVEQMKAQADTWRSQAIRALPSAKGSPFKHNGPPKRNSKMTGF